MMVHLNESAHIREIEPGLYSVLDAENVGAPYDDKAVAYDRMVSSDAYLRFAWGTSRAAFQQFMAQAFFSNDGLIVDLAAGTSLDAYELYAVTSRPTFAVDLSLEMLRKGKARLFAELGRIPSNVIFMQADALNLPFRDGCVATLLCHGGYHLFPSVQRVVSEWNRVVSQQGQLFVTSLVKERLLGNLYMSFLAKMGEISQPRSALEVERQIAVGLHRSVVAHTEGNFIFVRTTLE